MSITRRSMLAAAPAMGMAPIVPAISDPTEIATLFARWGDLQDEDYDGLTVAEANQRWEVYRDLQELITSMEPRTAKDLAMQFVVETDRGGSDYRDCFFDRIVALATA